MKKTMGALVLLTTTITAFGQKIMPESTSDEVCKLKEVPLERNVSIDGKSPEYFFKPIPKQNEKDKRDEVSLIIGGNNFVMNMENGALTVIPGPYDGVPTPDGKFIVSPANGDHIQFFERNGLKADSKPIYDDAQDSKNPLNGVYHSLGITGRKKVGANEHVTYKAITDTTTNDSTVNTLMYKSYTFEITPSGKKKLVKESGKPKLLCSNFDKKSIKTPLLSKDGKMLSAYNEESGTTIIYDISVDNKGNSKCKPKKDLGFATSKMEFSPDGKKVVFAMNSLQTTPSEVDWYSQPPTDTHNMNVFSYDFETDTVKKVSAQPEGNAYYPSFSNDGKDVVFLSQEITDQGTEYAVKRVKLSDVEAVKYVDYSTANDCTLLDPSIINMMALGKLWESVCSSLDNNMTLPALAMIPVSLSKDTCENLVSKNWENFQAIAEEKSYLTLDQGRGDKNFDKSDNDFYMKKFLSLKKDDLLGVCNTLKNDNGKVVNNANVVMNGDVFNPEAPQDSCTQCHSKSSEYYIPFDEPEKLGPYKEKMLKHVITGNMPKEKVLKTAEREKLIEYLEAIKDE